MDASTLYAIARTSNITPFPHELFHNWDLFIYERAWYNPSVATVKAELPLFTTHLNGTLTPVENPVNGTTYVEGVAIVISDTFVYSTPYLIYDLVSNQWVLSSIEDFTNLINLRGRRTTL